MELAIISSMILVGISIISLAVVNVVMIIRNSKDRTSLERLIKARDLREYELFASQGDEEEEEEAIEERYVPIEDIGKFIGQDKEDKK